MTNRLASRVPHFITHGKRVSLAKLDLAFARIMRQIIRDEPPLITGSAQLMAAVDDYDEVLLKMVAGSTAALRAENVPAEEWGA